MYLHIGGDYVIDRRDIIGVFDIENSTISNITKEFLRKCEKNGKIKTITTDIPKSFIITKKNNEIFVYLSSLASITLKKRFEEDENKYSI